MQNLLWIRTTTNDTPQLSIFWGHKSDRHFYKADAVDAHGLRAMKERRGLSKRSIIHITV